MELDFPHHYEALGDRTLCCHPPTSNSAPTPFCCRILPRPGEKTWPAIWAPGAASSPMLWFRRPEDAPKLAFGVDIQQKAIAQLTASVEKNGLGGRLIPICADLKDLPPQLESGRFDLVTCNPPYKVEGGES